MLSVSNLAASYQGSRILRDISLNVGSGEVVCLMGRNGVGKSTTLKTITGLVKPDRGSIKLATTELVDLGPDARARAGLGYVPQGRDIFPALTVNENLRLGALAQRRKHLNGEVDRVLELFPVLKEMLRRKGGVLSGGQQQQLAIGRALLTHPKVLLLDEPTEGIQPNIIDQIGETIKKLSAQGLKKNPRVAPSPPASQIEKVDQKAVPMPNKGQTDLNAEDRPYVAEIGAAIKRLKEEDGIGILLVEQYLDFCLEVGDRFYIMDRGSIVAQGAIPELNEDIIKQHLTV